MSNKTEAQLIREVIAELNKKHEAEVASKYELVDHATPSRRYEAAMKLIDKVNSDMVMLSHHMDELSSMHAGVSGLYLTHIHSEGDHGIIYFGISTTPCQCFKCENVMKS